jgi:hypothetical protein
MKTPEIAASAGITVRHLQRLMKAGEVPGASLTPSGRWVVQDSDELRKWCRNFQRWNGKVPAPAMRRKFPEIKVPQLPIVEDVAQAVKDYQQAVKVARKALEQAQAQAVRLGGSLAEKAKVRRGNDWSAFLSESGISPTDANSLMGMRRLLTGRVTMPLLKRIGVLDVAKAGGRASGFRAVKWIGWIGSTRAHFDSITRERPLSQWHPEEREAVADQLAPLVELHRRLEGRK